jgi:hypothetical protein
MPAATTPNSVVTIVLLLRLTDVCVVVLSGLLLIRVPEVSIFFMSLKCGRHGLIARAQRSDLLLPPKEEEPLLLSREVGSDSDQQFPYAV